MVMGAELLIIWEIVRWVGQVIRGKQQTQQDACINVDSMSDFQIDCLVAKHVPFGSLVAMITSPRFKRRTIKQYREKVLEDESDSSIRDKQFPF